MLSVEMLDAGLFKLVVTWIGLVVMTFVVES